MVWPSCRRPSRRVTDRRVALAVDERTRSLSDDDRVLADALQRHGCHVEPVVWGTRDLADTVVVIRSTWDYIDRVDDFLRWLDELDEAGAIVVNPTDVVRWNIHKRYLFDLADRGVPVVDTVLVERGSSSDLDAVLDERGWSTAIAKPAIGATARLTIRVDQTNRAASAEHVRRLATTEDVLVQPYVDSITTEGEVSIVVIDDTPERVPVDDEHAELASMALAAVDGDPTFARVDVVRVGDALRLMELELIEPDLFFSLAPESADRLASAIRRTT
jgi:glutathione synthase/RimK-type ligase-like ATP-grasp enzyme